MHLNATLPTGQMTITILVAIANPKVCGTESLFFCRDNYSYVHVGLYLLVELSLLALLGLHLLVGAKVPWSESSINCFARPTFVGGSESSRERKFQGAKVPRSEKSRERKFQGAKVPRSESSRE